MSWILPRVRISAATVSLLLCAGLVYSCTTPPARALPEEHETEQGTQREAAKREHWLRQRIENSHDTNCQGKLCPKVAQSSGDCVSDGCQVQTDPSEVARRNGLGAPLRL